MAVSRREFLKSSSAALATVAVASSSGESIVPPRQNLPQSDPNLRELALLALDAARTAGASYADVRISRTRAQSVQTREDRVTNLSDSDTMGFGVRVLVNGAWGFAASRDLSRNEVQRIARVAAQQARANRRAANRPVVLAPSPPVPDGRWASPAQVDPFTVPIEEKAELLLRVNQAALRVRGARFVNSGMFFLKDERTFANTEGTFTVQTITRSNPSVSVTAVASDQSDFQSRASDEVQAMGRGYEHILEADLIGRAPQWAEEAVQKLSARSVEPGRYDLVLDPTNLWLTIHESIGHPTELDRAMGYEANYAGTSFLAPPRAVLGSFRYGPEIMNIQADRRQEGALASIGWDDEGVPADQWLLVERGIFKDYQTTREQVAWIADITGVQRSHGCSYAQTWADVQFQRMPNVSLLPGERDLTVEDLIAATDRGIYIKGRGAYSIDQQRYNFQFGGQSFWEIRGGRLVGMLKDVTYQARTPEFWNAMDLIGGPRSYFLGGSF
ncbi:MAG TPA: TldD/PmbA family protein, partial [Gemmatimonadales bacterium]|nr:TldD/PmbA family protein [Gemmatimonadales bacterium]